MRKQFNVRLPQATINQINELVPQVSAESQAHIIMMAVNRMHKELELSKNPVGFEAEKDLWIVRQGGWSCLIQSVRKGERYTTHADSGTLMAEVDTEEKADTVASYLNKIQELENCSFDD